MRTVGTSTNGDYDLTTSGGISVYNQTPDASNPLRVYAHIELGDGTKNLTSTGGDFLVEILIGGVAVDGGQMTKTLGTNTRAIIQTDEFLVPANESVQIKIESPNADTDVDVTVQLYDSTPAQVTTGSLGRQIGISSAGVAYVDVLRVNGDATSAANWEAMTNGTGAALTLSTPLSVNLENDAITAAKIADNAITSDQFAQSAADLVWSSTTRTVTSAANITSEGIALVTNSGGVTVDTNDDKTGYFINGTKTTLDSLNDVSTADVKTQADTALADIYLDHLFKTSSLSPVDHTELVADDSFWALLTSKGVIADYTDYQNTQHSLEAQRDAIDTIDGVVDAILVDTDELQTNQGNWLTATGFSTHSAADVWNAVTRTLTAATNITSDGSAITMSSSGVVGTVNLVNTTTTNADMRGTDSAALATSLSSMQGDVTAILADTNELQTNQGNWLTATGFSTHSAADVASQVLTVALTESYATVNTQPTLSEILYEIRSHIVERSISGTTVTTKMIDGATTATTSTLDDATTPTSTTRAT
jgi:hypothetical protein